MLKKLSLTILFAALFLFIPTDRTMAEVNTGVPRFNIPDLQIKIPTVKLTEPKCDTGDTKGKNINCEVPWMGEYIVGIYKYAIGIVGILATIMMMIGGFKWLTAGGNSSAVKDAQSYITSSLTGLIIALSSYLILNQINPDLTNLKLSGISIIKPEKIVGSEEQSIILQLKEAGINTDSVIKSGVSLSGMKQEAVNEIISLYNDLKLRGVQNSLVITSGTEGTHAVGMYSHANGYKFDLRLNDQITNYFKTIYTCMGKRTNDNALVYKNSRGACYAIEDDHWDVSSVGCTTDNKIGCQ